MLSLEEAPAVFLPRVKGIPPITYISDTYQLATSEFRNNNSHSGKCQRSSRRTIERVEVSAVYCPYDWKRSLKANEPEVGQQHEYEMWQKSNETDFFLFINVFIFSNINVIPFKIVPLGSYTPMETLFPLLVAALEVVKHVRYTLLDDF